MSPSRPPVPPPRKSGGAQPVITPRSVPLAQALEGSESLAGLMQRVHDSRARLAAVADLLPLALRSSVRAGPLDVSAWVLLVDNAAAAAKLRQMLPSLVQRLTQAGWAGPEPQVKIQPRGPA